MATTYQTTPEPTMIDALKHLTRKEGPHARLANVTFQLVPAMGKVDEETGEAEAAFTSKGQELTWKREINSLGLRSQGVADVTVYIDVTKWNEMGTEARIATLDKALTTIDLVYKKGALASDDLGRPKLVNRNPDQVITIFNEVLDRNGPASEDVVAIKSIVRGHAQLFLAGMDPEEDKPPLRAVH